MTSASTNLGESRRVKLAIIRQRYNPFGGAERFVERALAGLARTDLEITLITRQWKGGEVSQQVDVRNPRYFGSTWRDASFAAAARQAVSAGAYDLVQSHEKIDCCDIYRAGDGLHRAWLARRARLLGPAGRVWLRCNPFNLYTLAAEERLYRSPRLKVVVCISELVKQEVQEHFGLDEARLPVIYNGIDGADFSPELRHHRTEVRARLGVPGDAPLFVFVGSGFERKGLAPLLRALPAEAWLLVVGKDKHEAAYRRLAERLGKAARVKFLGPQKDVRPYYGAANAFAFPTYYEPFGNVILEAMASGLPVLTTTDCGGAELIEEGVSGYVRSAGDREGLADALGRLGDPGHAAALGVRARETALRYNLENMTGRMIALYRELLG